MADQYHFDADPDPGTEKIRYGSGSRTSFDTDPDPGRNDAIRIQAKKKIQYQENLKNLI